MGSEVDGDQDWAAIRQAYVELAQDRNDAEFASTFFNTMYRRTHLEGPLASNILL